MKRNQSDTVMIPAELATPGILAAARTILLRRRAEHDIMTTPTARGCSIGRCVRCGLHVSTIGGVTEYRATAFGMRHWTTNAPNCKVKEEK